jgi:hypothetical protein
MSDYLEDFRKTAVHESGHVLGGLVDEYITCVPWDPVYADPPNCVRRDQMNANLTNPPWLPLIQAENAELGNADPPVEVRDLRGPQDLGLFNSCCDSIGQAFCMFNSGALTGDDLVNAYPRLGVYWGCMYRTGDPVQSIMDNIKECFPNNYPEMDCDVGCCRLELGMDFFRARTWCKMFSHEFPFCPVCSQELVDRIQAKTGYAPGP